MKPLLFCPSAKQDNSYPLSPLQHALLFRLLYERHPGTDLIQAWGDLQERLDEDRFQSAWAATVARHAVLRTSYHWQDQQIPSQFVHADSRLQYRTDDWQKSSPDAQLENWKTFLHEDRMRGFDFNKPPVRVFLVRLGHRHWRFCLTIHHLAIDGWSLHALMDEVFARYDARGALNLPPVQPYKDYIDWHQRQDWSNAEIFWKENLRGFTRVTGLPLANPKPPPHDAHYYSEDVTLRVPAKATADLLALAKNAGVTLHTVVQAAWAVLLSGLNQSKDIVFGSARRCRKSNVPGADKMLGLVVNTVPFRVHVPEKSTLLHWLREVRNCWVAMRDFENTPLRLIQQWSDAPPGSRLFETILNFFDPIWDAELQSRGGHWRKRTFGMRGQGGDFISLDVYAGGPELVLRMPCDPEWMNEETVRRLLEQFRSLLSCMCSRPNGLVSDLSPLSAEEKQEIVAAWNRTASPYPRESSISDLFEAQVKQTPLAAALSYRSKSLTYRQLDQRANRIAQYLRKQEVVPGAMVGICLERSIDLVAGMLAILKAGGVVVPLDPTYPADRMAHLLEDCAARTVLTREKFRPLLPAAGLSLVCLDSQRHEISDCPKDPLPCERAADAAACVFYTSGSTGSPKGVLVPHRGIVRLVKNNPYAGFVAGEKFLQFAPTSFDAASFEIWGPLLNGSQVAVFPPGLPSLAALGTFIETEKITTLFLTTGLFAEMITHWPTKLAKVKQLLVGGSVMPPASMRRALEKLPNCRIIHCYGPTENSTFTTCFEVNPAQVLRVPIAIGKPIANTTVYVLDERLQPVPIGVPGELYCGGDGVALGYLNAPELTAQKFIPNPFSNNPQARLYRSGDIARWLARGDLEFVGRNDSQVKIRGFRVEPEEIEQIMLAHPGVAQAVVQARADTNGVISLHAWYRPKKATPPPTVLAFLRGKLPSHMIPATLQAVDAMPLKANGKIDARALPVAQKQVVHEFEIAATPTQEVVRGLFNSALGLESVGMCDNFFELGGHSLKAMELVASIEQSFGIAIPVRTLFSSPTPESLAHWIEHRPRSPAAQSAPSLVPIAPGGALPPLFILPGGKGSDPEMLILARLARHLPHDQPYYGIDAKTVYQASITEVSAIAHFYLEQILAAYPHGPILLAGECIAGVIAHEMTRHLRQQGRQVHLILLDAFCPGALSKDEGADVLLNGLPENIRAYIALLASHQPGPYDGQVKIVASETSCGMHPTLGWQHGHHGHLQVEVVPGDHDSYIRQHAAQTGAALRAWLEYLAVEAAMVPA